MPDGPVPERFDAAYYREFYGRSPVQTAARIGSLAQGVLGLAAWWGIPVRSVLDVGAGPGYWGRWLRTNRPAIRYRSVDVSAEACRRYGHEQRDIVRWHSPRPVDLVVCQGVLHYLDDEDFEEALANLVTSARGLLFLEIPTSDDLRNVLDLDRTDMVANWRPAEWYRDRLHIALRELGAGVFYRRSGTAPFFAMEEASESRRTVRRQRHERAGMVRGPAVVPLSCSDSD